MWRLLLIASVLLLTGCETERINSLQPLQDPEQSALAASEPLYHLIQGTASFLTTAEVRLQVKEALDASPFDGAIPFDSLLALGTPTLADHLAAISAREGWSLDSALEELAPLQVYLPVREHRTVWQGGAELIVAGMISETEPPVAMDLRRNFIALGEDPPERPVLAITRAEINFEESIESQATANLATVESPGLYMTSYWVWDDHEHWLLGDPEFEMHTFVIVDDSTLQWVGCAGEDVYSSHYYFDGGTTWSGRVRLHRYDVVEGDSTIVQMWERDSTHWGCKGAEKGSQAYDPYRDAPRTSDSVWAWQISGFLTAALCPQSKPAQRHLCVALMSVVTWKLAVGSSDPDDFVGQVDIDGLCWREATGPVPARFWGVAGEDIYGRTGVLDVDAYDTTREPICPPHVRVSGPEEVCVDRHGFANPDPTYQATDVWGGEGTISFSWEEDGVPSGSDSFYRMQNTAPGERDIRVRMYRGSESASDAVRVTVRSWDDPVCGGGLSH